MTIIIIIIIIIKKGRENEKGKSRIRWCLHFKLVKITKYWADCEEVKKNCQADNKNVDTVL